MLIIISIIILIIIILLKWVIDNVINNQHIITLTFKVENSLKYPIVTLPNYKLSNIFLILLNQKFITYRYK